MKLIQPIPIGDAQLVSSSIPETDFGAWDVVATYAGGQHVVRGHRIWLASQGANIGKDPLTAGVSWWVDQGPTNRFGMFDGSVSTVSTADLSLTVVLAPGRIDSLALLNVDAAEVVVTQRVGSEITYQKTVSMIDNSAVIDWYSYFFEPIKILDYVLLTDIPVFGEATLEIVATKQAGTVSIGMCATGLQSAIGKTIKSPTASITDYSKKSTDDFGNAVLVQRGFSKRMATKVKIDNDDVDRVHALLASVRATPVVWIGSDSFSALAIYGFLKDFSIDLAYTNFSFCTLDVEGMI
ncbi:MAG: Carbohydrate binding protein [Proteobacteria bacterium]|nr:Carbohydrate binding protein [Pseudomonadota bacterium]